MSDHYDNDTEHWCDPHAVERDVCGCPYEPRHRFAAVPMTEFQAKPVEWLVPDLLPLSEAVVLVGQEGIGKGLFTTHLIAQITTASDPDNVLIIATEDDPERAIRPRLDAAGADIERVALITHPVTRTGTPLLPTHRDEVVRLVDEFQARLLIIDPWISTVPGGLSVRDPQQARQALEPLLHLTRETNITALPIAHTNRMSTSNLRDQIGLTGVLRQAARMTLMAIEDPTDQSGLFVGVDKSNLGQRPPAIRYVKEAAHGSARVVRDPRYGSVETIHDLAARFHRDQDGRSSDKWPQVVQAADGGMVTRSQVEQIYDDASDPKAAANKAIHRWMNCTPPRLKQSSRGVYEVIA